MRQAAAAYRPLLEGLSFDLLAATPLAGLPIGTAISLDMNVPLIYPRGTAKSYGTGKRIEGNWSAGQTVVVVDDLITSGDSLLQAIHYLREAGLQVIGMPPCSSTASRVVGQPWPIRDTIYIVPSI